MIKSRISVRLLPLDCLEGLPAGDSNRRAESLSLHPGPGRRDNLLVRGVVLLVLTLQVSAVFFTDLPGPVPGAAASRRTAHLRARLS
jgi:hypothetical protein